MANKVCRALALLALIGGLSASASANPISRAGSATKHGLASVGFAAKHGLVALGHSAVRVGEVPVHGVESLVHRV